MTGGNRERGQAQGAEREHAASAVAEETPVRLGEVVIVGGGCYGTFYAGQLEQARARGRAEYRRVLVVDKDPQCRMLQQLGERQDRRLIVREWSAFFQEYLDRADTVAPEDVIVPSPLMPHLMYQWLVWRARARWPGRLVETRPLPLSPGTPYDTAAPDSTRYVSFADWLCPTHCIEPAICPVIRGPRTWDMAEALTGLTERLGRRGPVAGPVLFLCRHQVFAVGTFGVAAVIEGDKLVSQAGAAGTPVDIVVGTVSACHGAVNLLHLGRG